MKRTVIWLIVIIGVALVYGVYDYIQSEIINKAKMEELNKLKMELEIDYEKILYKEKHVNEIHLHISTISYNIFEINNELASLNESQKPSKNYKKKIKLRDSLQHKMNEKVKLYQDEIERYDNMISKYNAKLKKASKLAKEVGEDLDLQPLY